LLPSSYLYVPADNSRFLEKAENSEAHAIILDLEDGVSSERKDLARENAYSFLEKTNRAYVALRVNLEAVQREKHLANQPKVRKVFLPKVNSAQVVRDFLTGSQCRKDLAVLIESAAGLQQINEIACIDQVQSIGLGEADLFADIVLGEQPHISLKNYARAQLIFASAAHSKIPPIAPVSTNFIDLEKYEAETIELRSMGYWGRACIHPSQVTIANQVFRRDEGKLEEARKIIEILQESQSGAEVALDGTMIDAAHLRWAKNYLARHADSGGVDN
jgi:citrate lyase subunit beta/citryl-CoA lyase